MGKFTTSLVNYLVNYHNLPMVIYHLTTLYMISHIVLFYILHPILRVIARVLCDNPCFFHLLIGTGLLRQTPYNKIVIIWNNPCVTGLFTTTHTITKMSSIFGIVHNYEER